MLFIPEGQKREGRELSEEQRSLRNRGALDREMYLLSSLWLDRVF
jgi:hypothetical protein